MARKKGPARSVWLHVIAVVLLLAGLILIFNRQIGDRMLAQNQSRALQTLNRKQVQKNQKKSGMFDFSKVKDADFAKITRARIKNNADAIGALAIPALKMYLPVMRGMSDDAMATGGGTMRSDQRMGRGNYPLAGHYMTAKGILFSPLENARSGQKIFLTDLNKVYVYRIYMKKKVDPSAVWLTDDTAKPIVTLITCADGGSRRWAIRGNLIQVKKASKQNLQVFRLQK